MRIVVRRTGYRMSVECMECRRTSATTRRSCTVRDLSSHKTVFSTPGRAAESGGDSLFFDRMQPQWFVRYVLTGADGITRYAQALTHESLANGRVPYGTDRGGCGD